MKGKVLYDYAASDENILALVAGQTIEILQKVKSVFVKLFIISNIKYHVIFKKM